MRAPPQPEDKEADDRAARDPVIQASGVPEHVKSRLREQIARVKELHEQDLALGLGEVWLPDALARGRAKRVRRVRPPRMAWAADSPGEETVCVALANRPRSCVHTAVRGARGSTSWFARGLFAPRVARKYPSAAKEIGWQYVFPSPDLSVDPLDGSTRRQHIHRSSIQRTVKEAVNAAGIRKPATCRTATTAGAEEALGTRREVLACRGPEPLLTGVASRSPVGRTGEKGRHACRRARPRTFSHTRGDTPTLPPRRAAASLGLSLDSGSRSCVPQALQFRRPVLPAFLRDLRRAPSRPPTPRSYSRNGSRPGRA